MRFMIIVKANKDSEAGKLPCKELFAEMGKFNEELATRVCCSRQRDCIPALKARA
jgi:hypothetical protein